MIINIHVIIGKNRLWNSDSVSLLLYTYVNVFFNTNINRIIKLNCGRS